MTLRCFGIITDNQIMLIINDMTIWRKASKAGWRGKTARRRWRECQIVSPMCEGACVWFGMHWMNASIIRKLCKLIHTINIDSASCVPNRLPRHGAYDLVGRVAAFLPAKTAVQAGFCLLAWPLQSGRDSLLTFSSKEKVRRSNQTAIKYWCLQGIRT